MTEHHQPDPSAGTPQHATPQYATPQGAGPQGMPPSYGAPQYGAPQYASDLQQAGSAYQTPAVTRPPAIDRAVLLMRVGAAVSLVSGFMPMIMRDQVKAELTKQGTQPGGKVLTGSEMDMALNFAVIGGIVMGLVYAGLWLWMSIANGKGRSWARVVASVFFGLNLVLTVFGLISGGSGSAIGLVLNVLILLIGAATIFFLYQKESSRYYEAASTRR